jgi:hypothetical protein
MALHILDRPCVEDKSNGDQTRTKRPPYASRNFLVTKNPKSGLQLNVAKYTARQLAIESKFSIPDQREYW